MIAAQADHPELVPLLLRQDFVDHAARVRATIHVVADEQQDRGPAGREPSSIIADALQKIPQEIRTTMYVADSVERNSIHATRSFAAHDTILFDGGLSDFGFRCLPKHDLCGAAKAPNLNPMAQTMKSQSGASARQAFSLHPDLKYAPRDRLASTDEPR
jgi:hypothetical protein